MLNLLSNAWTIARTTGRAFFPVGDEPARCGEKSRAGALTSAAGVRLHNVRQAKPSQAKPSQAKPSQAKPSQAKPVPAPAV